MLPKKMYLGDKLLYDGVTLIGLLGEGSPYLTDAYLIPEKLTLIKDNLVNALIGQGVGASTSESFSALISKIQSIT